MRGPIHEEILARRIARYHGFKKTGRKIRELVSRLAKDSHHLTKETVGIFYWGKNLLECNNMPCRYQERDAEMRNVEYICREELRTINDRLGIAGDVVSLSRKLGMSRLREPSRKRLEEALKKESDVLNLFSILD